MGNWPICNKQEFHQLFSTVNGKTESKSIKRNKKYTGILDNLLQKNIIFDADRSWWITFYNKNFEFQ